MPASILIVDDEKHTREGLRSALEDTYEIFLAADADEAFVQMDNHEFDVVLTDLKMAGKSGLKVIDRAIALSRKPVVIMMTAYGSVETAVEAMRRGAYDFMTKPVNLEKLEILIERAIESRKIVQENRTLHERLDKSFSFDSIIGHSKGLVDVIERVKLVAPSRASILIYGETGTGKELIAQSIHQNSARARGPFIAIHCAALPANLLESELFGYERGAFTGANERRIGRFEAADGGTLFLDEIGEIDPSTQVKLLRFLETRSFERLGSVKPISVDVRLVVATNKNLEEQVEEGNFREDLLFRLNVVTINLPPLRERTDDLPILLDFYLKRYAKENNLPAPTINADAMGVLLRYSWPGNIRELRNFCENAVVIFHGNTITEYDLDAKFLRTEGKQPRSSKIARHPLDVEQNERRLLRNALAQAHGNRSQAAKELGISRRTLHRKLNLWPELDIAPASSRRTTMQERTHPDTGKIQPPVPTSPGSTGSISL
ncbi:MAG: sigma-54 dependent transcriptional regulator [Verrucomicrobiota bacterium]|nr:sigma-54 dependent transcriptional regulator [Verrucomicrobiota bacterium]